MLLKKDRDQKWGMIKRDWGFKNSDPSGRCVGGAELLELCGLKFLFVTSCIPNVSVASVLEPGP